MPYDIDQDSKEFAEWKQRYRNLFSTTHGQVVLRDMLLELNFFSEVVTEKDRILSNYAKRLLFLIGGWTCELMK